MNLTEEDRRLIEEEEKLFLETIDSLCGQLPRVRADKISANLSARELTRQIVNEWNVEERQPLVSDEAVAHKVSEIRKESDHVLVELIREPYFGRVVTVEEDGREVSFKIGKKSNIEAGIVDWRNGPVSGLFFNYRQGEEFFEVINERERSGRIKVRRTYKTENGILTQIDTPHGMFCRRDNSWEKLESAKEAAAHRSRGIHSREKRLPSILSLVTREQFEMITTDPDRPVIIQGSAGSGKTTVALHRLGWLLHEDNSHARAQDTRVIVMNKSLQVYVSSTLPSMGIEGVETVTFNSWALSIIRHATGGRAFFRFRELPGFVEEIKFSEGILTALSRFVERQARDLDAAVVQAISPRYPHLLERWHNGASHAPLPRLGDFLHEVKQSDLPDKEKRSLQEFLHTLQVDLADHMGHLYDLLSDRKELAACLPAGPKQEEHLDYLCRLTEKNRKENHLDYFDMSLIVRLIQLKQGGLPDKKGGVLRLDHLVIDEAQDFGPVEFAIMVEAVRDRRHLTIVGDVSQKILFSRKFIGWDGILNTLDIRRDDLIHLEISYRCTVPIMNLARRIEGRAGPVTEGRAGADPVWHRATDRDDLLETVAHWVQRLLEQDPYKLIALICRYPKQAMELKDDLNGMVDSGVRVGHRDRFSFEPGVIATNVHQVKGLEFDAVALIEPSAEHYPGRRPEARNMLYVAVTRAQDELLIIGEKPFSPAFNQ